MEMRRFSSASQARLPGQKDWADIMMGWPFLTLIGLAVIGLFTSRLLVYEAYHLFSLVTGAILAIVFLVASVRRYRRGAAKLPDSFPFNRPALAAPFGVLLLFAFAYTAIAHGVPTVLSPLMTTQHTRTVKVSDKYETGFRSGFKNVLEVQDGYQFPGCALCVSDELWASVEPGDEILLIGRNSVFGLFVDRFSKIR